MKLLYHKGENFGDALNPIIFNHFLKNLLNDNEDEVLLGIGSILGLAKFPPGCTKIYVFSSGFGAGDVDTYGTLPRLDNRFQILCVRGPLTAKALNLPQNLAVSDGALLLPLVVPLDQVVKKHRFSFMPHVGTLKMYPHWKKICNDCDIHFIDPTESPSTVIKDLNATEVLISEAMHGVIVADAYRIPWIPVRTNPNINSFKWQDYLESVNLNYNPTDLHPIYSLGTLQSIFRKKLARYRLSLFSPLTATLFYTYQLLFIFPRLKKSLRKLKNQLPQLCAENVLKHKQTDLQEILINFNNSRNRMA